jgi:hypothetical protein
MYKVSTIWILLGASVLAQQGLVDKSYTTLQPVTTAPAGTCQPGSRPKLLVSSGAIYTCQSSSWATSVSGSVSSQMVSLYADTLSASGYVAASGVTTSAATVDLNIGNGEVIYQATSTTGLVISLETPTSSTAESYLLKDTGAYGYTLKDASATTIATVSSGDWVSLIWTGSAWSLVDQSNEALPLQISQGGTGATTASGARINLGVTASGGAVTIGSACSTIGLQGYNSSTGAPLYCSASLVWSSQTTSSMVLLNTITLSAAAASVSDTTSFTSAYKHYTIVYDNVLLTTGGTGCVLEIEFYFTGTGLVAGTGYYTAEWYNDAGANNAFSRNAQAYLCASSESATYTNSAVGVITGKSEIYNAQSSSYYKTVMSWVGQSAGYSTHPNQVYTVGTNQAYTATIYGVQISSYTGTFAAGSVFKIYGWN